MTICSEGERAREVVTDRLTECDRDVESDVHIARCGLLQIEYTFHEDGAIVAVARIMIRLMCPMQCKGW